MRFFKGLLKTLLVIFVASTLILVGVVWYFNRDLPNISSLTDEQLQVPLRVYTADGQVLAEFGEKRRQPMTLDQIPLLLQQAVIATEDQRFYEHGGVDFFGLARAAVQVMITHEKVQGGSTITMQVARNFFLDPKKTYTRKAKEILLALKIGRTLPKDKILELYLNKVYFGKRAYGVAAAAQVYYGETLDQLTLPQMAMLAGLPQAPSSANPLNNSKAALDRRNHVLERMYNQHYITQAEYESAKAAPETARYHALPIGVNAPYIAEMVRDAMYQQYGEATYTMGLKVYTTINSANQLSANQAVEAGLLAYDQRHGYRGAEANWGKINPNNLSEYANDLSEIPSVRDLQPALVVSASGQEINVLLDSGNVVTLSWKDSQWARKQFQQGRWVGTTPNVASDIVKVGDVIRVRETNGTWALSQLPEAEAAFVALNPQTGAVLALVGGFNFEASKFNRITSAKRQPGSAFKPFLYSAALADGYTLASLVNDAPIAVADQDSSGLWRPQNDTLKFYGPTRLRVALMNSRNLVSIRLLQQMGIPYAVNYIKIFGFTDEALPPSLSLALGTGSVVPLDLARGLSAFANGGSLVQPYFIQKVIDENDKVIFEAAAPTPTQIITPQNAYLINSAMKSVVSGGTGRGVRVLKRNDLAAKTGTTQIQNDNWFEGFNTQILGIAWVGFDQPRSTFENGAQSALPIWLNFMRQALQGMPESNLPVPPGIVTVRINTKTGQATSAIDKNSVFEIFTAGTAPHFNSNSNVVESENENNQPEPENDTQNQPLF